LVRNEDVWYLNSSVVRYVTPHMNWFTKYTPMSNGKFVLVGDDHKCEIKGVGIILIILINNTYKHTHKVLQVPEMAKNLLSTQEFRKCGLHIHLAKFIFIKDKEGSMIINFIEVNAFLRLINI
jgi:hypothetical protein